MSTDDRSKNASVVEDRVRRVAPLEPTDADLDAVRAKMRVGRKAPSRWVAARVASALVVLAVVAAGVLLYERAPSESAFAYEQAANALLAEDVVLHVVVAQSAYDSDLSTPEPDATISEETTSARTEWWIDSDGNGVRTEHSEPLFPLTQIPGEEDAWSKDTMIFADGVETMLNQTFGNPYGDSAYVGAFPDDGHDDPTFAPAWIARIASEVRAGNCGVSEETTDGVAVWRIAWDYDGSDFELHTEVSLRQSDYRPLTIEYVYTPGPEWQSPPTSVLFTIVEWEQIPYEDVAPDLFNADKLYLDGATQQIEYAPDDPRLLGFDEFPAWYLGPESDLGSLTGGAYDLRYNTGMPLEGKGTLSFTYGLERTLSTGTLVSPMHGYLVTTFEETDTAEADEWLDMVSPSEGWRTGAVDGIPYLVYSNSDFAIVRVVMEGHPVAIEAPDEASAVAAIGKLRPLE